MLTRALNIVKKWIWLSGQGRLSGCLQHYKHGGYRDLSDYQFVHADEVPADFELVCPICCETFATEEEMLQHAFEKIHHIAPRWGYNMYKNLPVYARMGTTGKFEDKI